MPLVSLESGLVVRHGARTLEFRAMIPGGKIQFEDQRTRLIQTFTLPRFYADMQNGNLVPVLVNEITHSAEHAAPLLLTSLSTLSPKRQEELDWRMGYIRAVRRRGLTRGQRRAIGRALPGIAKERGESTPPSVDAVMSWMRRFETAGDNPAAVVTRTRRRARRVHAVVEDAISNNIRSVYLTPSRNSLRDTLDLIDVDLRRKVKSGKLLEAEAKVSKATVYRRLQDIDPYDRDKARYGTNYARAKFRTSVEGVQAFRPLQRVECDHTPLNWVVVCDHSLLPLGRPTLTVMVDSYSGYVVGLYVSFYGPGLTSVLNVLKNAIQPKDQIAADAGATNPWLAWGICETLLLDNGLEFHSQQYQLAANLLGMDLGYCRVRTPWTKPKVERFFANLDYFSLPAGRIRKPLAHGENLDPDKDVSIFFSDFVRGLIKFVVDVYPFEPNSRKLQAPFDLFKEGMELLPPPAFLSSTRELDMVAAMSKEYTVSVGGVELYGISYSSEELAYLKKAVGSKFKTLVKWNPDDMSEVYLKDPRSDRWLIVPSLLPSYTAGLSFVQHRLIRAHLRAKHVEGGNAERLSRGREELREIWMNAQARGRGARNQKLAGKFSGLSSNRPCIEQNSRPSTLPLPRPLVLAKEEVTDQHREVPSYETFRMR